jgi:chemotaxis regulatin CheY-phosphate phosphatase CheZ
MIKNDDYGEILTRIKQIKSLFAFGEGILPFLEELFVFLKEVSPLLNDVSESIMNTTGLMPDAANELDTAVAETTDATYQIMNRVEHIMQHIDTLEMAQNPEDQESVAMLSEIRSDAMAIMTALQFHDIVSQKLVHVRRVMAEIQQKMLQLFTRVYELHIEDEIKENILTTFGVNIEKFHKIMESKINVDSRLTADAPAPDAMKKASPAAFNQDDIDDLFG